MAIKFLNDGDFPDNAKIRIGDANDLQIYHDGSNSYIDNNGGHLYIVQDVNDKDIIFQSDDGSGGVTTYFQLDGSNAKTAFSRNYQALDNVKAQFGDSNDLEIYHNASNSIIEDTGTGDLVIKFSNDLLIEGQDGANLINCNEGNSVQLYYNGSEKLETKSDGIEVTGNIDITSNGEVELDGNGGMLLNTSPSGNEGNGVIIKLHSTATTAGNLYYKSNFAAAWSETNAASGDGATRMLAVALGSNSGTDGMLLQGIFRKASHGFSAGAPLYVGEVNGEFTTTAPSTGGDYVRVVGYVIDSNTIYFSPGTAWVEVS
jgi:hypothetical protein